MRKEAGKSPAAETAAVRRYRAGSPAETAEVPVLRERRLELLLDGGAAARFLCTEGHLRELVLGWLLTEGHIRRLEDLASLDFDADASQTRARRGGELSPAPAAVLRPLPWRAEWIYAYAARLAQDTPLHRETRSAHSCFLCRGPEVLFAAEDIGRHNALDKAVGRALLRGLDLGQCALFTSGRIPTDMAWKAIRAGVPLLAGRGPATAEAAAVAREAGLSLVGQARQDGFLLYAGPEPEA